MTVSPGWKDWGLGRSGVSATAMSPKMPFGTTVAHGYLSLSLLPLLLGQVMTVTDAKMGVNYGFERVRFMAPVRSGKRVRGRFVLARFEEKKPGQWQFVHNVIVEIEGEEKPALVADWIGLIFL